MRRIYQDVAVQAEKEGWSYADFLTLLLAEEVAGRKQTRLQRLMGIPMKVFSDSDWIPVTGSEVKLIVFGAKRRWRSYPA
jgi:hypothetical protein